MMQTPDGRGYQLVAVPDGILWAARPQEGECPTCHTQGLLGLNSGLCFNCFCNAEDEKAKAND